MDSHPQLAFRSSATRRTDFFNKIVQALRAAGGRDADPGQVAAAASDMIRHTDELYALLTGQISYDAAVLDASMADYASFPLLAILQSTHAYPARLVENATKCLRVLLQHGWRARITGENAQRLLLLLTSVAAGQWTGAAPGTVPGTAGRPRPEETVAEGYRALAALVQAAGAVTTGPGSSESPLVTASTVPVLGHAVSVMLEGVTGSIIPAVQTEALAAVEALYTSIKDLEALASFLPGTVSALVRVVAQPGAHKTPRRVVVRTLEVLFAVLVHTLGDLPTRHLQREGERGPAIKDAVEREQGEQSETSGAVSSSEVRPQETTPNTNPVPKQKLDISWLRATAAQIKVALTSVLKLRSRESDDVRRAIQQFCVGLLDECHTSLADSTAILVESAIVTAPDEARDERDALSTLTGSAERLAAAGSFRSLGPQTTLPHLAILYPELADVIQTTAYKWATGLPRVMQASDEGVKQRALRHVRKAIAAVDALRIDSTMLQSSLAAALRDSVVTLAVASASTRAAVSEAVSDDAILQLAGPSAQLAPQAQPIHGAAAAMAAYKPVVLAPGSQKGTRDAILDLVAHMGPPAQQARLAAEMLDFVRDTDGIDQAAAFWLCFELVQASFAGAEDDPDSLLDLSSLHETSEAEAVLEDLFSFAVSALASYSDGTSAGTRENDGGGGGGGGPLVEERDWRVGALALEVTAYTAARLGPAFRPELIDVLYPIATYLGAREDRLRAHAVATLNSLAASCGYASVSELIVGNVDYMLNAVSLRLNTFDISPASTRVLTMMIRLAGPQLVPYLDDVVAAIFAALDNYHGYPLFVEQLFAVLGEVVRQSVQPSAAASLRIENGPSTVGRPSGMQKNMKRRHAASSTADLVALLDRRAKRRKERADEDEDGRGDDVEETGHPTRPWGEAASAADKLLRAHETKAGQDDADDSDNDEPPADTDREGKEVGKPEDPKTPTYALLARITTLTQHYLTSPTPTLRRSLLALLATVAPALAAADENAFLPLVNAVWPVVVARLYDGEPYVVVAACDALAALCASAGDFLATRIQAEWQANLAAFCARAKAAAASRVRGAASAAPGQPGRPGRKTPAAGTTDVVVPLRSSSTTTTTVSSSTGLGRFAQAVQVWEAVARLLTAVVSYVRLEDDVYDALLDRLLLPAATAAAGPASSASVRVLPPSEVQKARQALAVVNPDAVWLADYRARQLAGGGGSGSQGMEEEEEEDKDQEEDESWMVATPPVLAGVSFVRMQG